MDSFRAQFFGIEMGDMNSRRVLEIDRRIMQIQQSTRTLFRVSFPVHEWLRLHSIYYYLWSMKPYSRVVHWTALFLFICSLPAFYFSAFQNPEQLKAAADYTCTFTALTDNDWDDATNWSDCNAEYPGQTDATVYDVVIPTGKTASLNATNLNLNNADNSVTGSISVTGSLNTNNNNITFGSMTINSGGEITPGSSTLTLYDNWTNVGIFTHGTSTVVFTGGGTSLINSGGTTENFDFNIVTISGSTTLTTQTNGLKSATLNVTSGALDMAANDLSLDVTGTLTISASQNYYTGTAMQTIGTLTNSGNITCESSSEYISISVFTGSNAGWWTYTNNTGTVNVMTATYSDLVFNDAGGDAIFTMPSGTTNLTRSLYVNAGTVAIGSNTVNVTRNVLTNDLITISTGTLDVDGNSGIYGTGTLNCTGSSTINVKYHWNVTTFIAGDSTVTFNGSTVQTITGSNTWNNLVIANTAVAPSDTTDVDPTAAQTVTGTLTVSDGQYSAISGDIYNNVAISSDGILKPDELASISVLGNWTNGGTFTHNIGRVTFLGTTTTLISGDTEFNRLTFDVSSGSKQITFTAGTTQTISGVGELTFIGNTASKILSWRSTVSGSTYNLAFTVATEISSGITYVNVQDNTVVNGTITAGAGSTISNCTNWFSYSNIIAAGNYSNLTIDGSRGYSNYILGGTVNIAGDFTISGVSLSIGSETLNVSGLIVNNNTINIGTGTINVTGQIGGTIVCSGESKINIGGHWMAGAFTPSTSTVTFNGSSAQSVVQNFSWHNLIIANPAGIDYTGSLTVANNLTVNSGQLRLHYLNEFNLFNQSINNASIGAGGGIVQDNGVNISISGNWTNNGTFTASTGMFTFNGTGDTTISGTTTFNNLTMDASVDGAKTIYFASGKENTTTINGIWTLKGALGKIMTLRSNNNGQAWYFNIPKSFTSGDYINVKDSYSANDNRITPGSYVVNAGNNRGWNFTGSSGSTQITTGAEEITTSQTETEKPKSALENLIEDLKNNPTAQSIANVAEKVVEITAAIGLLPLIANIVGGAPAAIHAINYGVSLTLEALGVRKRRKSWGRVYDSTTGKGIDMAIIRLYDQENMQLMGTMITNIKGRYYFSVDPGVYAITVSKEGYIFPTEIFAKYGITNFSKIASRNNNQYVGQPINIDAKNNYLNIDVPMDPVNPDISTFLKIKILGKELFSYFIIGLPYVVIPILILGSLLSVFTAVIRPTDRNIILSVIYVALTAFYILSRYLRSSHAGVVIDKKTKEPIVKVMVSLFEKEHNNLKETRITDRYGRFSIYAPKGHYYLKAQKSGYTFTFSGEKDKNIVLKESNYIREIITGEKK